VTRRVVRLLVLLGALVAAYLVLSLFDHAARAVGASIDRVDATDPVASVKATATDARKAIREPKSIVPKSTAPKAHPQKAQRPTIKASRVHPPKIRAGETARRVQVRTSKLSQPMSNVVRGAAQATATPARRPALPQLAEMPDLPQAELPALPHLPSWPKFTSWPQFPSWPQLPGLPQAQLTAWPQLPSWTQPPGLPQAWTPILTRTTAAPSALVLHQPLMPSVSVQACPHPPALAGASGLSGVSKPPAAQAQPRTVPLPAPPRQPADRSTPTGQARDSGGGNTPAMGTVSSSWRPEVAAAGHCLATDLLARGRTVRYAGPPS
jgi:hypothetical protein